MRIRNEKDFWAGLMFVGFGLAFMVIAAGPPAFLVAVGQQFGFELRWGYAMGSAVRMGPAYFPIVLGGMLAVLGLAILGRSFFSQVQEKAARVRVPFGIVDLLFAVAVLVALTAASLWLWKSSEYGMLAAGVLLSVLATLFRPAARPLVLIVTACLAFAYLLRPLGLVLASILLVFVAALGGHEFRWREVVLLAAGLAVFSVLVFVKGLTLPFPIWPAFLS